MFGVWSLEILGFGAWGQGLGFRVLDCRDFTEGSWSFSYYVGGTESLISSKGVP